jgi:methionine biosynthesis protein MetW
MTRLDYQVIENHVAPGARVLDVGCGDGDLLAQLIHEKQVDGRGIDIDSGAARHCIARGIPVYNGDMLEGMAMFSDDSFDCVILSQTLQQTEKPARVVGEMLRVGRRAIISFPNFGHLAIRLRLLLTGRMPVTRDLPYSWYGTPNIHMLTVRDFRSLCREKGLSIVDSAFLTRKDRHVPGPLANLLAATAIFVLESRRQ